MPTHEYVQITSAGDDITSFTTFEGAEAAHRSDLVADDKVIHFVVHDDFGGWLTVSGDALFDLYTTDETRYVVIEAAAGDQCVYSEASGARLRFTNPHDSLGSYGRNIVVDGVTIKWDIGDASASGPTHVIATHIRHSFISSTRQTHPGQLVAINNVNSGLYQYDVDTVLLKRAGNSANKTMSGKPHSPFNGRNIVSIGGPIGTGIDQNGTADFNLSNSFIYNTEGTMIEIEDASKTRNIDNCAFSALSGHGTNQIIKITSDHFEDFSGGDYRTSSSSPLLVLNIGVLGTAAPSGATITIDQASVVPGGVISGEYSNFDIGSPPTTPLVISDGTNSITVPITVTPALPDDGTGTFSGTMPFLPAAGGSANLVVFGNVTATLDDA